MAYVAVYERGKAKAWKKSKNQYSGTCFSISFDQIEGLLKRDGLLSQEESVERFAVDEYGLTVFTDQCYPAGGPGSRPNIYDVLKSQTVKVTVKSNRRK